MDFDAIYLGTGKGGRDSLARAQSLDFMLEMDSVTFETGQSGVFAGGGIMRSEIRGRQYPRFRMAEELRFQ